MYLHFLKNSRTFDVQNTSEKCEPNFLNQNKAQAIRCKSFNFPLSGVFCSDLGLCFTLKNREMQNTPKTTTFKALSGETFTQEKVCTENGLRICKTSSDSQSLETFITFVPFTGISIETVAAIFEIAMESPDPAVFKKTFYTLAKQNQKLQQANTNN